MRRLHPLDAWRVMLTSSAQLKLEPQTAPRSGAAQEKHYISEIIPHYFHKDVIMMLVLMPLLSLEKNACPFPPSSLLS